MMRTLLSAILLMLAATLRAGVEVSIRDILCVRLTLDLDTMRLARCESALLTPVISDGAHRREMAPVHVNGTWRHRLYLRRMHRAADPRAVECGKHGAGPVDYADSCVFEPWMADARIILEEDRIRCGGHTRPASSRILASAIFRPRPDLYVICDRATADKDSCASREYYHDFGNNSRIPLHSVEMTFPINSTEVLCDYRDNREELKKVTDALDSLLSVPGIKIDVVELTGYASPEGHAPDNETLALRRAMAIRDLLQQYGKYRSLPFSTAGGGEDWQGLYDLVAKSDIPQRDMLLGIFGSANLTTDEKKKCLMLIEEGRVYDILCRDFFPKLRRSVCTIFYSIGAPDGAKLKSTTVR